MTYARRAVGPLSVDVHRIIKRPTCLPHGLRHTTRMPNVTAQRIIFKRDGWRCRFCGRKVICKEARAVIAKAFSIDAHWTRKEYQRHSALYTMASSLDHVVCMAEAERMKIQTSSLRVIAASLGAVSGHLKKRSSRIQGCGNPFWVGGMGCRGSWPTAHSLDLILTFPVNECS